MNAAEQGRTTDQARRMALAEAQRVAAEGRAHVDGMVARRCGGAPSVQRADRIVSALEACLSEVAQLRATNATLHRRVQSAEGALVQRIEAHGARSMGRVFANGAATMYKAQYQEALDRLLWLCQNVADAWPLRNELTFEAFCAEIDRRRGMLPAENETVLCSLRYPDTVCHLPSQRCGEEPPHLITECGEFDRPRGDA